MDLSFARFEHDATVTMLPPDLAVLLVGVAARQAASPTALVQSRIERAVPADTVFAPAHGAFSRPVAALLSARPWPPARANVNSPFTETVSGPASRGAYGR